jgi:hypothetical protein
VCRRSTTSCATCRHFRRGVASGLGLCGLDPRHVALRGTEMRPCWTAPEPVADDAPPVAARGVAPRAAAAGPARDPGERQPRTFVPVDELERPRAAPARVVAPPTVVADRAAADRAAGDRVAWSLWGDIEA